jgi:glycosyltransferase involved in cell wall biosynthesis
MRVALAFPLFHPGGAQSVAAWTAHAYAAQGAEVDILTFAPTTPAELDAIFGTGCAGLSVRILAFPRWHSVLRRLSGDTRMVSLEQHLLGRLVRARHEDYDLLISAWNEMDLGTRGLQYIHFPLFGRGLHEARVEGGFPDSRLRALYRGAVAALAGYSQRRMLTNLTVVNSEWTRDIVQRAYPIQADVVYPPVHTVAHPVPWAEREHAFLCVSRISREKRLEDVLSILGEVRHRGHKVRCTLVAGGQRSGAYRSDFLRSCKKQDEWLTVLKGLSRTDLDKLLETHRWGLHTMPKEHFGISIAEMVRAGCIPFLRRGGGQVEIVDHCDDLLYDTTDEAVEKICDLFEAPDRQQQILQHLGQVGDRFSTRTFCSTIFNKGMSVARPAEQA